MTTDYVVPDEPMDVAGRMSVVTLVDGMVPLAACMNHDAAVRIAELVNRYGLTDLPEDDGCPNDD